MSDKQLYNVRVEYDVVVAARTKKEAMDIADKVCSEEGEDMEEDTSDEMSA